MKPVTAPFFQQLFAARRTTAPAAKGPTPIDPADFKFIGGGSPRNGWLSSPTATLYTIESPRNGW